ncbi:MAG TPA: YkgJ family cysteine cluster protein [Candidatus Eisenbacteria bacterium]|jgi:Fe-S-cluster containining protein|nr:YkgJ family cysteine cluster protein [Candidatus Eisenbacteria bacterium]
MHDAPIRALPISLGKITPTCDGCIAHCCRYVAVEIERPRANWQLDQIRWLLLHENVSVYLGTDRKWYVEFRTKCRELGDDHRCNIYAARPDLCAAYEVKTCPRWATGAAHVVRFESDKAFAEYLALPPAERPGARPRKASKVSKVRPPSRRPARGRARSGDAGPKRGRSPRR